MLSVSKSCLTLHDPMDCSMTGFPVLHHLPEFAQLHVHWVSNAIQPSHPLLPSSSAFNLSQYQGLFQWVSCLHQVAKVLELQSLQKVWFPLRLTGLISWIFKWFSRVWSDSRVFSITTVQKHQFLHVLPFYGSALTFIHDYWKNHSLNYINFCQQSDISLLFNTL